MSKAVSRFADTTLIQHAQLSVGIKDQLTLEERSDE